MSRRKVPVHLNDHGIRDLPHADIVAILRAADDIIATGGRTLLCKILKGSRAQEVLKYGLEKNPAHGYYKALTPDDVMARIDWVIRKKYLAWTYAGLLPVLVYTRSGWEIERETYADEWFARLTSQRDAPGKAQLMKEFNERNREVVLIVLQRIAATGDPGYLPLLEEGLPVCFTKVRAEIRRVMAKLETADVC